MNVLEFPPELAPESPVNRLYLGEMMKRARHQLVELKARAADRGISVQTRMTRGIPSEEVLAAANVEDPDLIVVGTRGKTGLAHVLLGSTAERIIRTAPCPVLAVRAEGTGGEAAGTSRCDHAGLDQILVPIDFSDCSLDALEYGAMVAQRLKASVKLLHVLEPVSYGLDFTLSHMKTRESIKTVLTNRLSDAVSALTSSGLVSDFLIVGGLPADSILGAAAAQGIDVIVMGTHGRRGLSRTLFGSVTESVLRRSSCLVLTVRSPKFRPGHRRVLSGESPTDV